MNLINEVEKWQSDLEELGVEKAKADGRLEQAMAELKRKGFDTVEAAEKERDKRLRIKAEAEEKIAQKLEELKTKYADFIEVE